MKITIVKELKELAWNVSEEEYRNDPALSYSTLARYEKGGFGSISKLFEPLESDSLVFGSVVDTILTEGMDKFNEKFIISDIVPSEGISDILQTLATNYPSVLSLDEIPEEVVLETAKDWNSRLKDSTKLEKIKACSDYFSLIQQAKDKTIIDNKTYLEVTETVRAIRIHPLSSKYFGKDTDNIKKYYQLKFKTNIDGIDVRCMFDLVIVDYEHKWIMPIDLKTTSFPEYDFYRRYLEMRYDIQARLYWRILDKLIKEDEYFKDFTLYKFQFVCVNKFSLTPMSWYSDDCNQLGTIKYVTNSNRTYVLRDPIDIAGELRKYLDTNAKLPEGISIIKANNIQSWINKI